MDSPVEGLVVDRNFGGGFRLFDADPDRRDRDGIGHRYFGRLCYDLEARIAVVVDINGIAALRNHRRRSARNFKSKRRAYRRFSFSFRVGQVHL